METIQLPCYLSKTRLQSYFVCYEKLEQSRSEKAKQRKFYLVILRQKIKKHSGKLFFSVLGIILNPTTLATKVAENVFTGFKEVVVKKVNIESSKSKIQFRSATAKNVSEIGTYSLHGLLAEGASVKLTVISTVLEKPCFAIKQQFLMKGEAIYLTKTECGYRGVISTKNKLDENQGLVNFQPNGVDYQSSKYLRHYDFACSSYELVIEGDFGNGIEERYYPRLTSSNFQVQYQNFPNQDAVLVFQGFKDNCLCDQVPPRPRPLTSTDHDIEIG